MTAAEAEAFLSDTPAPNREAGDRLERMETQHEGRKPGQAVEDTGSVRASPAFRRSADIVRASIKNQLDAVGRFGPQVNDAYSSMMGSFYAVQAARLGVTPEDLFQRFPVSIVTENATENNVFRQALANAPPKGWKYSETGDDAVAMWNGEEPAKAVFWTNLGGRLRHDAPEVSEYSHSIDHSAIDHIRNRHGDPKKESQKGQLAITMADIVLIPDIVTDHNGLRTDIRSERGAPMLIYAKRVADGVLLYFEEASGKRQNLRAVSMRKYPPTADVKRVLENAVSPGPYAQDVLEAYRNNSISDDGLKQEEERTRGAYTPDTLTISMLKNADLTTFLHESGHFFLDAFGRLATDPASPNEIRADMDAALRWIGVAGETSEARLAAWQGMDVEGKRSGHEQWTRGFEAYLLEGKAPSIEMQGLFQ